MAEYLETLSEGKHICIVSNDGYAECEFTVSRKLPDDRTPYTPPLTGF